MTYYPNQETGVSVQFPLVRVRRWQTLETRSEGGHVTRGLQPEARRVRWQLDYVDLSDVEATSLTDLFEQSRGGLKSFVFVDPLANLMRDSERIGQGQWMLSSGVSVALGGAERPAVFQLSNGGQATGTVGQAVTLPPGREFCLSCWLLGGAGQMVGLRIGGHLHQVTTRGEWQRVWVTAEGEDSGATECALEVAAGGMLGVHSIQLEQQPTPSGYRAGTMGGVYPETRFDQDSLEVVASGPGRNGVRVKLVSRLTE